MVHTTSIFRVLDCGYNEDCKSAKRHRFAAQFVQQTASKYLPHQLHNNNKPAAYKHLTLLLHVSAYIGRHLTSHICIKATHLTTTTTWIPPTQKVPQNV
jgi:hypothetical protein